MRQQNIGDRIVVLFNPVDDRQVDMSRVDKNSVPAILWSDEICIGILGERKVAEDLQKSASS